MVDALTCITAWAVCTVLRRVAEKGSDLYSVCVFTVGPLGFGPISKGSGKHEDCRISDSAPLFREN